MGYLSWVASTLLVGVASSAYTRSKIKLRGARQASADAVPPGTPGGQHIPKCMCPGSRGFDWPEEPEEYEPVYGKMFKGGTPPPDEVEVVTMSVHLANQVRSDNATLASLIAKTLNIPKSRVQLIPWSWNQESSPQASYVALIQESHGTKISHVAVPSWSCVCPQSPINRPVLAKGTDPEIHEYIPHPMRVMPVAAFHAMQAAGQLGQQGSAGSSEDEMGGQAPVPLPGRVQMLTRDPCTVKQLYEHTEDYREEIADALGVPVEQVVIEKPPAIVGGNQMLTSPVETVYTAPDGISVSSEEFSNSVPTIPEGMLATNVALPPPPVFHEHFPKDGDDHRFSFLALESCTQMTFKARAREKSSELQVSAAPAPAFAPAPSPLAVFSPGPAPMEQKPIFVPDPYQPGITPPYVPPPVPGWNIFGSPSPALFAAPAPGPAPVPAPAPAPMPLGPFEANRPWIAFWSVSILPPNSEVFAKELLLQVDTPGSRLSHLLPKTLARVPGMKYPGFDGKQNAIHEIRLPPPTDSAIGFSLPTPINIEEEKKLHMKQTNMKESDLHRIEKDMKIAQEAINLGKTVQENLKMADKRFTNAAEEYGKKIERHAMTPPNFPGWVEATANTTNGESPYPPGWWDIPT